MAGKPIKGWFTTRGRPGDRTLAQQLTGLDDLVAQVPRKTVLDVGCAEGLIAMHLCRQGATAVHGIEVVPGHVEVANELRMVDRLPCTFEVADANAYKPVRQYDIVLMLAVLQKLKDPTAACKRFAAAARSLVVMRLPPKYAPIIIDSRSGNETHNMKRAMEATGFKLGHVVNGPLGEWMGYFERQP